MSRGATRRDGEDDLLGPFVTLADRAIGLALGGPRGIEAAAAVVDEAAEALGVDRDLARGAVVLASPLAPSVAQLPPQRALEAHLALLVSLGPVAAASLWVERAGVLGQAVAVGGSGSSPRSRAVAADTFRGVEAGPRATLVGVPVERFGQIAAALVLRVRASQRDRACLLARKLAPALAVVLEKETLLERNAVRERSLVEATERRLVRLGLDLHDGPLQDLAALLSETRLLRGQLEQLPSLDERRSLVTGRLDDFEARVLGVEAELRAIIQPLEHGSLVDVPFFELVERAASGYSDGSLEVTLRTRGDAGGLTQSQRVALLRVVEEALANVRAHSAATRASVTVSIGRSYLRAEVQDDGRGFDVARAYADAARSGRLGLAGMAERVRLLGGRLDVRSDPGAGTTVSAAIPRWDAARDAAR